MIIKIGTDCSGIEAPIQALHKICKRRKQLSYHHSFSSEIDPYAIKCIKENYNPDILYEDMVKRDINTLPDIDIYVSGFPCQPFSIANKFKSPVDPRLNLFHNCVDVIFQCKPSCFILENVITLLTLNDSSYFKDIIQQLERDNMYDIHWSKMNTKDYGLPQSRKRLYIVGLRKYVYKKEFRFPAKLKMQELTKFIDKGNKTKNPIKESNYELFQNIPKDSIFIDVGFRKCSFPNSNKWAPCITAQPNMWCVPMQRKASVKEYLKLQGFPLSFKQPDDISDHQMKIKVGNSMTVDVIELIMKELFRSLKWI